MKKVLSIFLMSCMLFTAFGIYTVLPVAAVADTVWNFDTAADASAWSYGNGASNGGVSNSILTVNANKAANSGGSCYMQLPTTSVDIDAYQTINIKLKNATAAVNGQFYFYIGSAWVQPAFTIAANMTDYVEYSINVASYTGIVTKIMFGFGTSADACSGSMYIDYIKFTNPAEYAWNFNTDNDFEGWTGYMRFDSRTVAGGYMGMNALGLSGSQSPAIYSPSTFTCSAVDYPTLKIKLKNGTASTSIGAYFSTTTDMAWSESKKVSATITANSSDYVEYTINMASNANWTGTFKQFMLSFGNVTGAISIDYIKLTKPEYKTEWNFDDNTTNGWSAWGTHTTTAASGAMTATRTASGQGAVNSPVVSLATANYKYLVLGINSATTTSLKFYFKCDANGYNETNTKTITITPSTTFKEYYVDFSGTANWTGNFVGYMMMLNADGNIVCDYIKMVNTYTPYIPPANQVTVSIASTANTITTPNGTVTLTPTVTSGTTLSDYGVIWKADTVNATVTKNGDGTATLTGKINGTITMTAISKADSTAKATKTITISGQGNKTAKYDQKVMLFGNSILNHGVNAGLGWYGSWGMAASAQDKDYVHRLMNYYVQQKYGTLDFSMYGFASFETSVLANDTYVYTTELAAIKAAVEAYQPDIVNLQMGENVHSSPTAAQYANAVGQLVATIQTASPGVKVMLCTPFWGGSNLISGINMVAAQYNLPISNLSTLGTTENEAIGLFANSGVAMHPSDTGMDNIAKLIWANMDDVIDANFPAEYDLLPDTITVSSDSNTITTDAGTMQMTATISPEAAGQGVTWSVDNTDLATIGTDGLLTAKNNGTVIVKATSVLNTVYGTKTITISGQTTPYTVTYLAGTTDTVTNLPAANNFAKGTFALSTQKPARSTYQFIGWSLTEGGTVVSSVQITGNVSVYAVWKKASTWEFNAADYLEGVTVQNGFNVFVLNGKLMSIATGTDVGTGNVLRVTSPTLSLDTASYKAFILKLQNTAFNASSKVTLVVQTTDGNKTYQKSITSIYDTQYNFDISDCTGTITGFYIEPTNIDCTINVDFMRFASGTKVNYNANTTDTVTGIPSTEYVFDGSSTYTVNTAIPVRTNYTFMGWSETAGGTTPVGAQITVSSEKTLYAIWKYNTSWDFNTDGNLEGWTGGNLSSSTVSGGYWNVTAANKGTVDVPSYDPTLAVTPALADTNIYTKVRVRMSYTLLPGVTSTNCQVFFKTEAQTTLSESVSKSTTLVGNTSNGFIDVDLDMASNSLWGNSKLTYLRVDPISGGGSVQIDSIKLLATTTATFGANGGTGTAMANVYPVLGEAITLPACAYAKTGYVFAGWSDGTNVVSAGSSYTIAQTVTNFTAVWAEDTGAAIIGKNWEFNINGDVEGWTASKIDNFTTLNGVLKGASNIAVGQTPDDRISSPSIIMDPAYSLLKFRMKVTSDVSPNAGIAYFVRSGESINADKQVNYTVTPNAGFVEYTIDMSTHALWNANIYQLFLDAVRGVVGTSFEIDYIRLYRKGNHTITYNANAGADTVTSLPASDTMAAIGTGYTLSATTPVRSGYLFTGWSTTAGGSIVSNNQINVTGDATLYAVWESVPTTVTVSFTGGSGATGTAPTPIVANYGGVITLPANTFTYVGYDFAGWFDGTKTVAANASYTVSTSNITLTAQWTKHYYSVTYSGGTGATGSVAGTTKQEGTQFTLPGNGFTKTGYYFTGWRYDTGLYVPGSNFAKITMPQGDITVTAEWLPNATLSTPGTSAYLGDMTFESGQIPFYSTSKLEIVVDPTNASNHVLKYTKTSDYSNFFQNVKFEAGRRYKGSMKVYIDPTSTKATVGAQMNAEWNDPAPHSPAHAHILSFVNAVPGTWYDKSIDIDVPLTADLTTRNTDVTLYTNPLFTNSATTGYYGYVLYDNISFTPYYKVTYNAGAGTGAPADAWVLGSSYTVSSTVPTRSGYNFLGWSKDGTNVITTVTLTNADVALTALWQAKYNLSFDKNTTDTVTSLPTTQILNANEAFNLASYIPVRSNYNFLGWSTDTTAANIVSTITLTSGNGVLYAIWQAKYTLSFDANTTDAVTSMPETQTLNENQAFDLAAFIPVRTNYNFMGWSTDTTSENIVTSVSLTANDTLYAIWEVKTEEVVITPATSTKPGMKEIRDAFGNFIRNEVINVLNHFGNKRGKQITQGTTADSPTTTVRLIMGINSLEYAKAGFIIAARDDLDKEVYNSGDKYTVLINSNTVYTSIVAGGVTYTAESFGAQYLVAIEIEDFPKEAYTNQMRVQGFVVALDGTTYHYDSSAIITVDELIGQGGN